MAPMNTRYMSNESKDRNTMEIDSRQPPDVSTDPDVIEEALEQASRIIETTKELPEAGWEFAESVAEQCRSMSNNIERWERVTEKQLETLDNWETGLAKWLD